MSVDRRGHVVLVLLFALLLAACGMALLSHGELHVQVVAARRNRRMAATAREQALLLGLHRYREKLAAADLQSAADPEAELCRQDFLPPWNEGEIEVSLESSRRLLRSGEGFRVTRLEGLLRAVSRGGRREHAGRATVDLVSGDVPAGEAGLVIGGAAAPAAPWLAGRSVGYHGSLLPQVGCPEPAIDPGKLLAAALGLPLELPDWRAIREAFGLEPSGAPVPAGVYLAGDAGKVRAVFVEGDLQKLVFAAARGWQEIAFVSAGQTRELRYRPGEASLAWSGDPGFAGACFAEKIVVHGNVWEIRQEGAAAFGDQARIELVASGRLNIATGLEGENLQAGSKRFPKVLLMTCGRDFFSSEAVDGDVAFVHAGDAVVDAQVIAAGSIVHGRGRLDLVGGLLAAGVENQGEIHVRGSAGDFELGLQARIPGFRLLRDFRVHFIEERIHDEPQGADGL
mgnify:CR=1 FL=1